MEILNQKPLGTRYCNALLQFILKKLLKLSQSSQISNYQQIACIIQDKECRNRGKRLGSYLLLKAFLGAQVS